MRRVLLIVAVAVIAGLGWKFGFGGAEAPAAKEARPVAVVAARRGDLASTLSLSAELTPFEEIDVQAKEAGYLKDLRVDIGDRVRAGEVIATLDIDELKDDVARARADYHDAKLEYDRIAAVARKRPGLLAQAEVDKSQAAYEVARANAQRAQTLLDYATIRAPFDGVVTKRYTNPGALIQTGVSSDTQSMPLVHIADVSTLRLMFPVPESAVPQVHVGTPVEVTVDATGQKIEGRVTRLADKVDSATRTMQTEVDLDNRRLQLTPGMYATATIRLAEASDVLCLPVQAVALGDKPNVWVVDAGGTIVPRPVTVGMATPREVEITSGLAAGEQAVFGSRAALAPGERVEARPVGGAG